VKFTRHTLPGIIGAVLLAGGLAACGTAAANGHPAATSPAAAARPAPHKTTQAPATTAPAAQATHPASGPGTSQDAATGIVYRYIQLLNSQDFQDAWNMGGDVLSHGVGYDAWVAGYSGTAKTTV